MTIVFQNGGGLRASIDQGVVTMGEVLTVLPFQNTLATFQLTGKDIVASLEHGVSMIEEGKGAFPQVAGLKYSFDKSVAPNAGRIKSVEVMESGAWAPIDEAKTLHGRHQQLHARRRRRLQAVRRQCAERLRLRSGPRAGGRRLSDREPALHAEARRPHHRGRRRGRRAGRTGACRRPQQRPAEPAVPAPPAGSADIASTPPTVGQLLRHLPQPRQPPAAHRRRARTPSSPATRCGTSPKKVYGDGSKWQADRRRQSGRQRRDDLTVGATLKIPPAS